MQHDGRAPRWYRGGFGSIPNVGSGNPEPAAAAAQVGTATISSAGISLGENAAFQAAQPSSNLGARSKYAGVADWLRHVLAKHDKWVRFPSPARTNDVQHWGALRAANLQGLGSIPGHVSECSRCWTALGLLSQSGQVRHLAGARRFLCPVRLLARSRPPQGRGVGSIPTRGAMSLLAERAPTLRTLVAVVRLHPGTLLALARGSGAAPPKRGSAVRLSTRAPRVWATGGPLASYARNRRFNSVPR